MPVSGFFLVGSSATSRSCLPVLNTAAAQQHICRASASPWARCPSQPQVRAGVAAVPHQQVGCELRKRIPSLAIFCCLNNLQTSLVPGYQHLSLAHILCHGCRLAAIPLHVSSHTESQLEEQPQCGICPLLGQRGPARGQAKHTVSFKVSAQMHCMSISHSKSHPALVGWAEVCSAHEKPRAGGYDPLTGSETGTVANRQDRRQEQSQIDTITKAY